MVQPHDDEPFATFYEHERNGRGMRASAMAVRYARLATSRSSSP